MILTEGDPSRHVVQGAQKLLRVAGVSEDKLKLSQYLYASFPSKLPVIFSWDIHTMASMFSLVCQKKKRMTVVKLRAQCGDYSKGFL